jgi:penicillin-insensitive murein DD-endopeptidase
MLPTLRMILIGTTLVSTVLASTVLGTSGVAWAQDEADPAPVAAAPIVAKPLTGKPLTGKPLPAAYTMPAKKLFGTQKTPAKMAPVAVGSYAKGCLAGGKALPINGPSWQAMRLSRNRNWGHPGLVKLLARFAEEMREQDNWPGLLVGDMSQPRGGPMLTGHRSHQIGLDADIWYMPMPARTMTRAEREKLEPLKLSEEKGTEVIAANWKPDFVKLIRRAASYSQVERIFTHPAVKKALCDATPVNDRGWLRKVRPMWSHNYHFHIRMHCPVDVAGCVPQKPTLPDDGCGKDLTDWLKRVSAPPPKPKPKPTVPAPPKKPAPKPRILTVRDLPAPCTEVALYGTNQPILAPLAAPASTEQAAIEPSAPVQAAPVPAAVPQPLEPLSPP